MSSAFCFVCFSLLALLSWLPQGKALRLSLSTAVGKHGELFVTRLSHTDRIRNKIGIGSMAPHSFGLSQAQPQRRIGTEVSARQMKALEVSRDMTQIIHGFTNHDPLRFGLTSSVRPAKVQAMRLTDLAGTEYAGVVAIGAVVNGTHKSAESELRVIFDTGSADLWVASDLCTQGPCAKPKRRRYNHSRSISFKPYKIRTMLETQYGSGKIKGVLGYDDVRLGPFTVRAQPLGLIDDEVGYIFEGLALEGVVGLGFAELSYCKPAMLDGLKLQNDFSRPEFAFYLHRDSRKGGAVIWGSSWQETRGLYEGELTWFPVVKEKYWALDLLGFRLGNGSDLIQNLHQSDAKRTLRSSSGKPALSARPRAIVVVDSGTTFFTAPTAFEHALSALLKYGNCDDVHQLPPLMYTIGDGKGGSQELVVQPEVYMVHSLLRERCESGFIFMNGPGDEPPMMIIGEVFMRHHFTVFRAGSPSSVGFARSQDGPEADTLLE